MVWEATITIECFLVVWPLQSMVFQWFLVLLPSLSMVFNGIGPLVKQCDGFDGSLWSITHCHGGDTSAWAQVLWHRLKMSLDGLEGFEMLSFLLGLDHWWLLDSSPWQWDFKEKKNTTWLREFLPHRINRVLDWHPGTGCISSLLIFNRSSFWVFYFFPLALDEKYLLAKFWKLDWVFHMR